MIRQDLIDQLRVPSGKTVRLEEYPTDWDYAEELQVLGKDAVRELAERELAQDQKNLAEAQERLYADNRYSVLIILQARDAAGKDSTIKHVMSGVNPAGCQVHSFKRPSEEELDHTFLWRCMTRLPERGKIGIFNRSHYEEVLVVKVHPGFLDAQCLPPGDRGKEFWQARYEDINAFEHHLVRNGTLVLKFFLHVSKNEQKERFLKRLDEPDKNWKFNAGDLAERKLWDQYTEAYEQALSATSTPWAPWYVVPADQKWATRAVVADVITDAIHALGVEYPKVSDAEKKTMAQAKADLLAEK